jgi:sporulation protein YlmC with PRC-barrel domain
MAQQNTVSLVRLGDSEHVLADPGEDIRGREVHDCDGNDIGKVDDLLIDAEHHKVRFLIVEHGGILGFGTTPSYVPVEAVARIEQDAVQVDESGERVAGAPRYDPDLLDRLEFEELYGYYGYTPFWTPGYVHPRYPHDR